MAIKIGSQDVNEIPGISKVYVGSELVWPISVPYLEIQPEVIWLTPWAQNDVLSNTSWDIE